MMQVKSVLRPFSCRQNYLKHSSIATACKGFWTRCPRQVLIFTNQLSGTEAKTKKIPLSSWRNDFQAGQTDEYTVQAMDVGELLMIQLHNDGSRRWYKNPDWFVNKITVASSKHEKPFEFPCYRWVVSDMIVYQGTGISICLVFWETKISD